MAQPFRSAKFESEDQDEYEEYYFAKYQVIRCLGCDGIRFREVHASTHDFNPDGSLEETVKIYPEVKHEAWKPISISALPEKVRGIYLETVAGYNSGANTLAGGGLRAIVEAICLERGVSGANLQQRIDGLVATNLLARPQADLLHEERYLGNAALHEMSRPSKQDLEDGLQIIEGLLTTIYLLPERAARLRAKRTGEELDEEVE